MEVQLNKLTGITETPLGPVTQESMGIWRVDVFDDSIKGRPLRLESGMLHVGFIGRQPDANFMENPSYRMFGTEDQEFILAEVRRLHGDASLEPPVTLVDLPEDSEQYEDDEEEEEDEEETDDPTDTFDD